MVRTRSNGRCHRVTSSRTASSDLVRSSQLPVGRPSTRNCVAETIEKPEPIHDQLTYSLSIGCCLFSLATLAHAERPLWDRDRYRQLSRETALSWKNMTPVPKESCVTSNWAALSQLTQFGSLPPSKSSSFSMGFSTLVGSKSLRTICPLRRKTS